MTTLALNQTAVVVSTADNVAIAKRDLPSGTRIELPDARVVILTGDVSPGNRFATDAIPKAEFVTQYGHPIGTSLGIQIGDPITHDNMSNDVPVVRELPADLHTPPTDLLPVSERGTFQGFVRPDGRVGTRNYALIVPTSMCASHEARQIATIAEFTLCNRETYPNVDGAVAIPHSLGCGCSDGTNIEVTLRTLANYADHPNVGAVIFMDLGCEKTNLSVMEKYLKQNNTTSYNKPVHWVSIQESGGTQAAIEKGLAHIKEMLPILNESERSECSIEHLVLGVECGGSDGFSGLSANPSCGHAADILVKNGGTVMISEVPEFCGAEHILAHRAKDAKTGRAVYALVDWYKEYAGRFGTKLDDNPSPGNVKGGLLNITIKSLGAIAKAGTTRVEGTIDYAERPKSRGLHLMQGPGYDQESVPGIVASGATVVVFTTGRGTTIGNAITPVIKLATNTPIFERMKNDLDLSAGGVIDGTETIAEVGDRVLEYITKVSSGEIQSKAEITGHREFQIWSEQSVSL